MRALQAINIMFTIALWADHTLLVQPHGMAGADPGGSREQGARGGGGGGGGPAPPPPPPPPSAA